MTIENIREGSSVIRQFVELSFVALRPPLPAMFNGSLRAENSNSIYSTVYVKVRQVCLRQFTVVVMLLPSYPLDFWQVGIIKSVDVKQRMIVINCSFSFECARSD